MITCITRDGLMVEVGPEAKIRNLFKSENYEGGKEVRTMDQLQGFNFWTQEVDHKTLFSAQGILKGGSALAENSHSTGCTSDQGGSQENGGGDCSTDSSGE